MIEVNLAQINSAVSRCNISNGQWCVPNTWCDGKLSTLFSPANRCQSSLWSFAIHLHCIAWINHSVLGEIPFQRRGDRKGKDETEAGRSCYRAAVKPGPLRWWWWKRSEGRRTGRSFSSAAVWPWPWSWERVVGEEQRCPAAIRDIFLVSSSKK